MFKSFRVFIIGIVCGFIIFISAFNWLGHTPEEKGLLKDVDTNKYLDIVTEDHEQDIKKIIGKIGEKLEPQDDKFVTDQKLGKKDIEVTITERQKEAEKVKDAKTIAEVSVNNNLKKKKVRNEDKHLNKLTKNTNILCLGVDNGKLKIASIYSINRNNKKSAGIFLPTRTSIEINHELLTLNDIYKKYGAENTKNIISKCMEIDVPYYMEVDKKGLVDLSELIGPLYVEDENIDIPNLFTRPISPKDDVILQDLAKEITKTKVVDYPKLLNIFVKNIKSDLGIKGAWNLYKVFKDLNHSELAKVILWGEKVERDGKQYLMIDPYDWHNMVYKMTE